MSLLTKIITTTSIIAMALALAPVANAVTVNPTTSSTGNYIYCSNVSPFIATSDINAVLVTDGNMVKFNYTQNVVANVENNICKPTAIITGTVPNIADHTTTFDIDSVGKVTNIKVSNTNPTQYTTLCDGTKTVLTVTDTEKDILSLTGSVSGNPDFDVTTTTETGKIKITFARKFNSFTSYNNINLYVSESPISLNGVYGNSASGTVLTAITAPTVVSTAAYDVVPGFTNFLVKVIGDCSNPISSSSSSATTASNFSQSSQIPTNTSSSSMISSNSSVSYLSSSLSSISYSILNNSSVAGIVGSTPIIGNGTVIIIGANISSTSSAKSSTVSSSSTTNTTANPASNVTSASSSISSATTQAISNIKANEVVNFDTKCGSQSCKIQVTFKNAINDGSISFNALSSKDAYEGLQGELVYGLVGDLKGLNKDDIKEIKLYIGDSNLDTTNLVAQFSNSPWVATSINKDSNGYYVNIPSGFKQFAVTKVANSTNNSNSIAGNLFRTGGFYLIPSILGLIVAGFAVISVRSSFNNSKE